jgi:hypothetical protein
MSVRRIFRSCLAIVLLSPALRAQMPAQASSPSLPAKHVKKSSPTSESKVDSGSVSDQVYLNKSFGIACKIPAGWVLRTEEMNSRDGASDAGQAEAKDAGKVRDASGGRVLLAAFSRPPEARAEDVNASILIAAESSAAYPGLKDAAQYFGPVIEVAKAQGFEIDDDPYEFVVGTKPVVRGDFQKDVGTRVMRQSTLVMLARGYAVSFTFIGGTEDEVEELVQGLSFVAAKTAH